jgi:hypothetical protein
MKIILESQIRQNIKAYIDDVVVKSERMEVCLTTTRKHSTISVSTKWSLTLKSVYLMYHQGSCLATWYWLEVSMCYTLFVGKNKTLGDNLYK